MELWHSGDGFAWLRLKKPAGGIAPKCGFSSKWPILYIRLKNGYQMGCPGKRKHGYQNLRSQPLRSFNFEPRPNGCLVFGVGARFLVGF